MVYKENRFGDFKRLKAMRLNRITEVLCDINQIISYVTFIVYLQRRTKELQDSVLFMID